MSGLSGNPNLMFLRGSSPEELYFYLKQIVVPYKVLSIYQEEKGHIAWIVCERYIDKKRLIKFSQFRKTKGDK